MRVVEQTEEDVLQKKKKKKKKCLAAVSDSLPETDCSSLSMWMICRWCDTAHSPAPCTLHSEQQVPLS